MDVFEMKFAKVFPLLIAKAERKGRTADEVFEVACWLTGYTKENLNELLNSDSTYGEFLDKAPRMNPDRLRVKGKVCGVPWTSWWTTWPRGKRWRRLSGSKNSLRHSKPCGCSKVKKVEAAVAVFPYSLSMVCVRLMYV